MGMRPLFMAMALAGACLAAPIVAATPATAAGAVGIEWVNPASDIGMFTDPLEFDLKLTGLEADTAGLGVRLTTPKLGVPASANFLDFWEFTGTKWEKLDTNEGSTAVLSYIGPVDNGTATIRIALAGNNDIAPNGPGVGEDPVKFQVVADVVNLDAGGKPIGTPLASADHTVTADLLDATAAWPATLQVGMAAVVKVDYVNPSEATFLQPIAGAVSENAIWDRNPELYFSSIDNKNPKIDVRWSDTKAGPWHSIKPNADGNDGVVYELPELSLGPKSTKSIWLQVTYRTPADAKHLDVLRWLDPCD